AHAHQGGRRTRSGDHGGHDELAPREAGGDRPVRASARRRGAFTGRNTAARRHSGGGSPRRTLRHGEERQIRERCARRARPPYGTDVVRILLVNWQDRENPQAGGAEIHLHEIFGRLAVAGHDVRLLCGGWSNCPDRAPLDNIDVYRTGTRPTFPFLARPYYTTYLHGWADALVEA